MILRLRTLGCLLFEGLTGGVLSVVGKAGLRGVESTAAAYVLAPAPGVTRTPARLGAFSGIAGRDRSALLVRQTR